MNTNHKEIEEVIIKDLLGEATDEEVSWLTAWLAESENNRIQYELIRAIWQERAPDPQAIQAQEALEKIWRKGINSSGGSGPVRRSFIDYLIDYLPNIAAAFLLFVLPPILIFFFSTFVNNEEAPVMISYVVKENRAAERSRFMLPDGSIVWLHCESSLRYPENFSAAERSVELTGEAFFEVKKDLVRPFVVNSGDLATTALGTSFNVAAYPDKNVIEVALITGRVKVENNGRDDQPVVLDPGMGISYDRDKHKVTQRAIDKNSVLAWKSGVLLFEGDNYQEFVRKIEQWYGVTVTTQGKVPTSWEIRGRFDNEFLSNVLDVVSFNKDFKYQLNDKELTLIF